MADRSDGPQNVANQNADKILVLGATGNTGGHVARRLIGLGLRPRLLVRDAAKAAGFEVGADIVEGSIENPKALAAAMKGVKKVYLVSSGTEGPDLEVIAIDAARKAGVNHVVKLSVLTTEAPLVEFARWHSKPELHLKGSGLAWTMLRCGYFHSNALYMWSPTVGTDSVFYQPVGNGKWASLDPADIGEVAAKALTEPGHEGKAYTLTGPEALDAAGYASVLSHVLGRPVQFVDVPADAARAGMADLGLDPTYTDAAIDMLTAIRDGVYDVVSSDLEDVLGRPAISFKTWAEQNSGAFESGAAIRAYNSAASAIH